MSKPCGTNAKYTRGCRCKECKAAHNLDASTKRRQQAYGRYDDHKRPTIKSLNHLKLLRQHGYTREQISKGTGVGTTTLGRIERQVETRIQAATERRILALKPDPAHANPNATTDPTGTVRRLRALQRLGWSQQQLATFAEMQVAHIHKLTHQKTGATIKTAQRISRLYDELWDATPNPWKGNNTLAANTARRNGWLPPLAWDEDRIDDPTHTGYPEAVAA